MKVLIRHDGAVVTHDAKEVCRELLDNLDEEPDFDLVGFVVRNMGWVWFEEKDREIEVRLNPSTVTLPAIIKTVIFLTRSPAHTFTLRYLDSTGWVVKRFNERNLVVDRLDKICATSFVDSGRRFQIETKTVSSVTDHKMRRLMDCWVASNATFSVGVIDTFIQRDLLPRMVIVHGDRQVLRFVGDQLVILGGMPTVPIRDLPDREYGAWIEPHYREVSTMRIPRCDRITAAITAPFVSRVVMYDRLMLPWKCHDATGTIVTTLSSHVMPPVNFTRADDPPAAREGMMAYSLYRSVKALLGAT